MFINKLHKFFQKFAFFIIGGVLSISLYGATSALATIYPAGSMLQPGDVTSSHIRDNTIVNADINTAAAIIYSKLTAPGSDNNVTFNTAGVPSADPAFRYYTSGRNLLISDGKISASSTNFGGVNYTWPATTTGATGYLQTTATGTLSWGGSLSMDIQTFTASSTWTKPTGAKLIKVYVMGGGGGGGSGAGGGGFGSGNGSGGSGGAGGAFGQKTFNANAVGATSTVIVGAGGTGGGAGGGGAQEVSGQRGNDSSFGTTVLLKATGGSGGIKGTLGGGTGVIATSTMANGDVWMWGGEGGSGGTNTSGVGGTAMNTATTTSARGGGGGGGCSGVGGNGGSFITYYVNAGGSGGALGTNGSVGNNISTNLMIGGTGAGGGGGGNGSGNAGGYGVSGGTYGSGGGGGGGGCGTGGGGYGLGGEGGNGAGGFVIVVTSF